MFIDGSHKIITVMIFLFLFAEYSLKNNTYLLHIQRAKNIICTAYAYIVRQSDNYTVSQKNCTPKAGRHKFCYFPNTKKSEI